MRAFSDPHTTWTMSGVALRIAQRIGIHRDGSRHGLSIFETEMRRRIWSQLIIMDSTSAQFCGVASSPMLKTADTQPPMNINDSDLDIRMMEPAREKEGPTEMIFCLTRCEFGKWLQRWSKDAGRPSDSPWAFLSSSSMSLKEKDDAIDELEALMEQKFLRYCDRSIPLHLATTMMARSAIHYTRLVAHHPRQYQDSNARIPQTEKDIIFETCLKMTENADYGQMHADCQRFAWHTENHMPWDAMIFMLSEMRFRTDPDEIGKVWVIISNIYSRHVRHARKNAQRPLHTALQNLIVKAWRAYIEKCNLHSWAPIPCPTIVITLLDNAQGVTDSQLTNEASRTTPHGDILREDPHHDVSTAGFDVDADAYVLFNDVPMNWNEWDNLLSQFQESLAHDMTLLQG